MRFKLFQEALWIPRSCNQNANIWDSIQDLWQRLNQHGQTFSILFKATNKTDGISRPSRIYRGICKAPGIDAIGNNHRICIKMYSQSFASSFTDSNTCIEFFDHRLHKGCDCKCNLLSGRCCVKSSHHRSFCRPTSKK